MSEDRICPFMSRPGNYEIRMLASTRDEVDKAKEAVKDIPFIPCQKDRCAAWEKHNPVDEYDTFEGGRCRLIP